MPLPYTSACSADKRVDTPNARNSLSVPQIVSRMSDDIMTFMVRCISDSRFVQHLMLRHRYCLPLPYLVIVSIYRCVPPMPTPILSEPHLQLGATAARAMG